MTAREPRASADRARIYRALAGLFRTPDAVLLKKLRGEYLPELREALGRLGADDALAEAADQLTHLLGQTCVEELGRSYQDTFEASGGSRCAPNETSHAAESPQEALLRTFQLADIAGFYRAFGVEAVPESERVDHIAIELEFMHLLAVKEAVAQDAASAFLRDHLSRWGPEFGRLLGEAARDPVYAAAGRLLERFLELERSPVGSC
jgi:TorA maturation chaperone TorD